MSTYSITLKTFGEKAVLVEWPASVETAILDDILSYRTYLENNGFSKTEWEMIPAYNSLAIISLTGELDFPTLFRKLPKLYKKAKHSRTYKPCILKLPVCYDAEFGIDLEEVGRHLNLGADEIIDLHTSNIYTVFCIGFLPGFMYLGGLPKELEIPRKSSPRLKVPKGSVGLAGKQTGIYPQESPGGWNIIGKCPIPIFNPEKNSPCLVNVGDKIQFFAIGKNEFELRKIESEVGIYNVEKEFSDD